MCARVTKLLLVWEWHDSPHTSLCTHIVFHNVHQRVRLGCPRFSCGNHRLPIASGRFQNTRKEIRQCELFQLNEISNEFHCLRGGIRHPCQSITLDKSIFPESYYVKQPNTFKMTCLFNTNRHKELILKLTWAVCANYVEILTNLGAVFVSHTQWCWCQFLTSNRSLYQVKIWIL